MSSLFSNFSSSENLEQVKDSLGGYQPLDSGAYEAVVKTVYITHSNKGAMAANLVLDIEGREYKEQLWITNSNGENFYKSKSGGKVGLPGFTVLNDLCLCAVGKELKEMEPEERVFKLYDYDTKQEMPKEVPTIVDLQDTEIIVGIVKQVVDKTTKNDSGVYVPTGETREENVIDKIFHAASHKTVAEAKAGAKEASFYDKWVAKNTGMTRNRAKGAKAEGTAGAPQKPATKKPSLFN